MKKLIINGKETGSVKDYNQDRKSQVWIFNMEDGRDGGGSIQNHETVLQR